jgi:hypothetical protein|tara:strand:- start:6695 stop:7222 length:528 start_codon:yes stop_codon:yes gene_type:complete
MSTERKPRGYWNNKENCLIEAKKYSTRGEFSKACGGAYAAATRNDWIDEICSHMIKVRDAYEPILQKFLKENFQFLSESDLSSQFTLLSCLIKIDGLEFWEKHIAAPPFKLNSLFWLRTYDGKKYLEDQRRLFKTNQNLANISKEKEVKEITLDEAPEQNEVNKRKTKSIIDFLG